MFFQVCRSKNFHEFGLTKVRGVKREQLKHNPYCHVNRLLFMGLAKPTEAITTRMGEQLLGYAFVGLNVKFRSDFGFFFCGRSDFEFEGGDEVDDFFFFTIWF